MSNIITINGVKYKTPKSIDDVNDKAEGCIYGSMFLKDVFTGREDWDRIESEGGDWMNDSECFSAYGSHYGVNGDDALLNDVGDALYALFMNYDEDEWEVHLLEPVKD